MVLTKTRKIGLLAIANLAVGFALLTFDRDGMPALGASYNRAQYGGGTEEDST